MMKLHKLALFVSALAAATPLLAQTSHQVSDQSAKGTAATTPRDDVTDRSTARPSGSASSSSSEAIGASGTSSPDGSVGAASTATAADAALPAQKRSTMGPAGRAGGVNAGPGPDVGPRGGERTR